MAGMLLYEPAYSRMGDSGLPRAWRALKGWRLGTPARCRQPHPFGLWAGIAVAMAMQDHVQMAVMTLLMFSADLRPGEAFNMLQGDIAPPAAGVPPYFSLLIFRAENPERSKIGTSDNSILLDHLHLQWMAPLLNELRKGNPEERVWNFTYPDYLQVLGDIAAVLKVKVVPYQLRHCGASHDRLHRLRSLDEVMKRGR